MLRIKNKNILFIGSGLIIFYIHGSSYSAEKDMTWEEWVQSKYNTDGLTLHYVSESQTFIIDSNGYYVVYDGLAVVSEDNIEENVDYDWSHGSILNTVV